MMVFSCASHTQLDCWLLKKKNNTCTFISAMGAIEEEVEQYSSLTDIPVPAGTGLPSEGMGPMGICSIDGQL
jgi:hypothetical protein